MINLVTHGHRAFLFGGNGQEDIFPVTQFEKLWSDLSLLTDLHTAYIVVDRLRGQQLKDPSQLDAWYRDGSADYIAELCGWGARG